MAAPAPRHQASLEGLIDFSAAAEPFANDEERAQAVGRFRRIVGYFEALEKPSSGYGDGYNRPALVRLTFEYARSQQSKDKFLMVFFQSLAIGLLDDDNVDLADDSAVADLRDALFGLAEFLMTNFYLPRMPISQPAYLALADKEQYERVRTRHLSRLPSTALLYSKPKHSPINSGYKTL
jgi:hypothetical protein